MMIFVPKGRGCRDLDDQIDFELNLEGLMPG